MLQGDFCLKQLYSNFKSWNVARRALTASCGRVKNKRGKKVRRVVFDPPREPLPSPARAGAELTRIHTLACRSFDSVVGVTLVLPRWVRSSHSLCFRGLARGVKKSGHPIGLTGASRTRAYLAPSQPWASSLQKLLGRMSLPSSGDRTNDRCGCGI